ncbi:hypothetical protein GW17_00039634 [Ensete ventricosum]|nr:hypothetical protein GW17_00039634 [Ensete ventricosum]
MPLTSNTSFIPATVSDGDEFTLPPLTLRGHSHTSPPTSRTTSTVTPSTAPPTTSRSRPPTSSSATTSSTSAPPPPSEIASLPSSRPVLARWPRFSL